MSAPTITPAPPQPKISDFAHAHEADRVRLADGDDWQNSLLLITEPVPCPDGGCGARCYTGLTDTGRRVPVHAAPSTPVLVLASLRGDR